MGRLANRVDNGKKGAVFSMAKFLLATMPIPGHVNPFTPVAKALVECGHQVLWYGSRHFQSKIEATGARFAPIQSAIDYGDNDYDRHFPARAGRTGTNLIVFDFEKLFFEPTEGMLKDLSLLIESFAPDVILGDPAVAAVGLLGELGQALTATLNITVFSLASPDMPPFGLALPFDASPIGKARNAAMRLLARRLLFGKLNERYAAFRKSLNLPSAPFEPIAGRNLYLQPSSPSLEYPVKTIAPQVHFIGALLPEAPKDFTPPEWWEEVISATKPVVHVTQGTIATEAGQLIEPTIHALAQEDVLLVVTTGGKSVDTVGIQPLPANVRIASFIPHVHLLPHVDIMVTNGGFGAVTQALANGVPMVVAGASEDKPEVAARIAYSGVGVNLKTGTPTQEQVRDAVRHILSDATYRTKANTLKTEMTSLGGAGKAADLLEQLANTRKPVLRA